MVVFIHFGNNWLLIFLCNSSIIIFGVYSIIVKFIQKINKIPLKSTWYNLLLSNRLNNKLRVKN